MEQQHKEHNEKQEEFNKQIQTNLRHTHTHTKKVVTNSHGSTNL